MTYRRIYIDNLRTKVIILLDEYRADNQLCFDVVNVECGKE